MTASQGKLLSRKAPFVYDMKLLLPVLFLVGIGLVMIYSASSHIAYKAHNMDGGYYLKRQLFYVIIGIGVLLATSHIPYRYYSKFSYLILLFAFFLMSAVFIPGLGCNVNGANRWIRLFGITFQPAELARMSFIIYLAYSLTKKQKNIHNFSVSFIPHFIVLFLFISLLIKQPDFGSVIIFSLITYMMMYVSGVRLVQLIVTLIPMIVTAASFIVSTPYRISRIVSFLDPWAYQNKEGYQIIHSHMAFGSGGFLGVGIGKSIQKMFYLPEPHTDFILSIIGEEMGFIGVFIIILVYSIIIKRGMEIADSSRDIFGSLLATGFTVSFGLQSCINMGVALGLLPTKGLTLPFISYGGSSLILNMASIGILMNIGAENERQDVSENE